MPWKTGATDSIRGRGDGRPQADHAGWQPVRLQGIERGNGIYEVDADAIVNATRTPTASATPPSTSCTTSPRHPRPAPTTTLS